MEEARVRLQRPQEIVLLLGDLIKYQYDFLDLLEVDPRGHTHILLHTPVWETSIRGLKVSPKICIRLCYLVLR